MRQLRRILNTFGRAIAAAIDTRAPLPASVHIVDPEGPPTVSADGRSRSVQAAELTMATDPAIELWSAESLERLARTYWRFLERISLGLIRVRYSDSDRAIVLLSRPLVLIGFDPPEYELEAERGLVRWRIRRGLLVSRHQGSGGSLQIDVRRLPDPAAGQTAVYVEVAVLSFYPSIVGGFGGRVYSATQSIIHVLITHAFLRSLGRLSLAQSRTAQFATGAKEVRER